MKFSIWRVLFLAAMLIFLEPEHNTTQCAVAFDVNKPSIIAEALGDRGVATFPHTHAIFAVRYDGLYTYEFSVSRFGGIWWQQYASHRRRLQKPNPYGIVIRGHSDSIPGEPNRILVHYANELLCVRAIDFPFVQRQSQV